MLRLRRLALLAAVAALAACSGAPSEDTGASEANATECGSGPGNFLNMDDACKRKVQPTNRERTLSCPVVSSDTTGFATSAEPRQLDDAAFNSVAPFDAKKPVRVSGVLIRRVDGVPYYRYVSNGHHDEIVQPWSSSKFIAPLAAASNLRAKSGGKVGLTASVDGKPLGDLVTDIETYQSRLSSSNGTARWFKNVAGRDLANALVIDWLDRPGEEFRGGYGTDLARFSFAFTAPSGDKVSVQPDDRSGITNVLSMFTEMEMMKRVAMWDDAATRVSNVQAEDVQTLLYGAETSVAYKGEAGGGMQRDKAIYMQNAVDLPTVEAQSQGRWRIFSKLGYGESTRDGLGYVGELVHVAYACLPVLDAAGQPIPDQGAEFALAIHATAKNGLKGDVELNALYRRVVQDVMLPHAQPR